MRVRVAAILVALAAVAAGCGGTVGAGSGGDGAKLVPDTAIAFVSIDTSFSSDQWKAVDQLSAKFPIKAKALEMLKAQLQQNSGLDFDQDVKPALGDELDAAFFKTDSGKFDAVALLQPHDQQKLDALITKGNASSKSGKPAIHEQVDGWTVISDDQAAIDAVKAAANGHSLADVASYQDAMHAVSQDSLVKAYVNGAEVSKLVPAGGMLAAAPPHLSWAALRLTAHADSVELAVASKGTGAKHVAAYHPALLRDAPSNAIAFASFKGYDRILKQLLASPGVSFFTGAIETRLGVRLQALTPLLSGEGAFWVRPGAPIPDVALDLQEKDPQSALATLTKLAHGVARLTNAKVVTKQTAAGRLTALDLGRLSVYLAAVGGRVVITNGATVVSDMKSGGPRLENDAAFKTALTKANVPDKTVGLAYVNLQQAVSVILGYAGLAGANIPPDVRANLEPLRALVAYGSEDGGIGRYDLVLETR